MCTHSHILVANDRIHCIDFPFEIIFKVEKRFEWRKKRTVVRMRIGEHYYFWSFTTLTKRAKRGGDQYVCLRQAPSLPAKLMLRLSQIRYSSSKTFICSPGALSFLYFPESRPCNRAGNKPRQSNYHESNVEQCYMILYLHVLELACDWRYSHLSHRPPPTQIFVHDLRWSCACSTAGRANAQQTRTQEANNEKLGYLLWQRKANYMTFTNSLKSVIFFSMFLTGSLQKTSKRAHGLTPVQSRR